jgi:soluble cytochrome b562
MPSQLISNNSSYPLTYTYSSGATTTYVNNYVGYRRSRVWSQTPNFKKTARRSLTTLGYTDETWVNRIGYTTVSLPALNGGCKSVYPLGPFSVYPTVTDAPLTQLWDNVVTKAANKVGAYTVDLGVAAAEAHKTSNMILSAAKDIAKAGLAVRRGDFAGAARTLGIRTPTKARSSRSFHNNWLEYRYGWRTLVMDIDGAMKALAESYIQKPPMMVVKAVQRTSYNSTIPSTRLVLSDALGAGDALVVRSYDYSYEASIVYRFTVQNPYLTSANSLGLVNLTTTAWELIPYSFVVDWFVNVGDVLRNLTSFTGKTFVDGSKCLVGEISCLSSADSYRGRVTTGVYTPGIGPKIYSMSKNRIFSRTKLSSFVGVTPRLNIELNTGRVTDAAAMLLQRFLR